MADPHSGQKREVNRLPLSPRVDHSFDAPVIVTWPSGQRACAAKALPERFWQSRQWQTETRTGSPSQLAVNWPQRQVAVRVAFLFMSIPEFDAWFVNIRNRRKGEALRNALNI